jgi:hypothetical protein
MSTPAISKNASFITPGIHYVISGGVRTDKPYNTQVTKVSQESRPASITNRKDASGWRQPSGWSHSVYEATPCPIGGNFRTQTKIATQQGHPEDGEYWFDGAGWSASTSALPGFPGTLIPRAEIAALQKLKNQKVNLAQAFLEREQTARLFTSACTKIAHTVQAYRSKNPKWIWDLIVVNEGSRGRPIPQSWLELQYGWRPLMSDVYGSADALRETEGNGNAYRVSVTATAKQTDPISWKKGTGVFGPPVLYINVHGKVKHIARVNLVYKLENPLLASLASIGVTNPLALAWELLPYSFVVDWFTPLGSWINSMDAALGYSFLGGSRTVFQELEESGKGFSGTFGNPLGTTIVPLGYPSYYCRRMSMTRTVYSSSPLPRFPGFKNPLSTGHVANAMALLATAFR